MTVTAAWLAAETERMRDQLEADLLAAELGCEVIPHLRFARIFEARNPTPSTWLLSGTAEEIRQEWRAALMLDDARAPQRRRVTSWSAPTHISVVSSGRAGS
jgi:hypothetical protein